jgi:16S rRNA (cytidine1402-2'-O)-methyltransferase
MTALIYLIPNTLGDTSPEYSLTPGLIKTVQSLKHFIVENEKSARKFLMMCGVRPPFEGIRMYVLDKHTTPAEMSGILTSIGSNESGLLSEAGCPAVADPGAVLVKMAHERKIQVKPLVGPSSILLALMASGFNGQAFSFHGYLPVQQAERVRKIKELENLAQNSGYSQLFIETPFRNEALLGDLVNTCQPGTMLSVACDLTLESEEIRSMPASRWKTGDWKLRGRPAVFSLWVPALPSKKPKYERPAGNN